MSRDGERNELLWFEIRAVTIIGQQQLVVSS